MDSTNWIPDMPLVAPDVEAPRIKDGNTAKMEVAVWAMIGLASSFVLIRFYYHLFRGRRRLWSDDYVLLAALLCLIGNGIAIQHWIPYKLEPNVTTDASVGLVLTGSLMGLFNSLALALSKTSLGFTFIRLTTGWWKSSLGIAVFAFNILLLVQAWSYWIQDCDGPLEPFRVQSQGQGCISFESIQSLRLSVQIFSCCLDLYFTVLPWKIVRSLELKRFERIGLTIAMSFGALSLTCGLIRLSVLTRLASEPYDHQPFYAVGGYLFNFLEPGWSIIAACIPILRKVVLDIIRWHEMSDFDVHDWIPKRLRRRGDTTILPISEDKRGSPLEEESTSQKTDTTLVVPESPPKAVTRSTTLVVPPIPPKSAARTTTLVVPEIPPKAITQSTTIIVADITPKAVTQSTTLVVPEIPPKAVTQSTTLVAPPIPPKSPARSTILVAPPIPPKSPARLKKLAAPPIPPKSPARLRRGNVGTSTKQAESPTTTTEKV
ncbi:hypothetical protein F4802DRAFT_601195 [Xylaria palmicola]|nr:hypothetical protein F4802DRAFT_601195 [Xylaria palmicola]